MITGIGLAFLPICIAYILNPARLLELVFVGSAFAAAAVIVIGGYGIAPGLIPTALFIGFVMLELILGTRYPAERTVLKVFLPFILVVLWGLISSFLMPRIFEAEIYVWPQKITNFVVISPLEPNSGNLTQDMYLAAAAMLAIFSGIYLTRTGFNLRRLLDAYFVSGLMVVFISLWQFLGHAAGIWFPTDFFLSNPGWALLSDETVGSVIRITGPFSEPSALAAYLCGSVGGAGWLVLNGHEGKLPRLLLGSAALVILLSTSTTGYVALPLMAIAVVLYAAVAGSAGLRKRVAIGSAGLVVFALACVVTVPAVSPGLADTVVKIANATLNKQQSSSYDARTSSDRDSVHAAEESYGLGVGWGSDRSSSLIPGLLAGVGAVGMVGLIWFGFAVAAHVRRAHRLAVSKETRRIMHGCTGAILGTLIAAVISTPTISSPDFFLLLALLVATAARVRFEASLAKLESKPSAAPAGPRLYAGSRLDRA